MTVPLQFVNFLSGEEASDVDLNRLRDFARAREDMLIGSQLGRVGPASYDPSFPSDTNVYAVGAGGALSPVPSFLRVTNKRGLIAMYASASAPDGATPKLQMYYLDEAELQTTFDAADATNPRVDLLCVQISSADGPTELRDFQDEATGVATSTACVTTKRAQLATQVVKGTASATPVPGAVPSGYAVIAEVYVPAAATQFTDWNVSDLRYPVGYQKLFVPSSVGYVLTPGTDWVYNTTAPSYRYSHANEYIFIPCPVTDPLARLLRVWTHGSNIGALGLNFVNTLSNTSTSHGSAGVAFSLSPDDTTRTANQPRAWWCGGAGHAQPDIYSGGAVPGHLMVAVQAASAGAILYGLSFEFAGAS